MSAFLESSTKTENLATIKSADELSIRWQSIRAALTDSLSKKRQHPRDLRKWWSIFVCLFETVGEQLLCIHTVYPHCVSTLCESSTACLFADAIAKLG